MDVHDPPAWMRELVILRDRHRVFPGCTVDARACDLDHLQPYVPLDDGGPPGQRRRRTSRACAEDTTGSRPSPAGVTAASPTASRPTGRVRRTSGPARTSAPTASPPTPPAEPRHYVGRGAPPRWLRCPSPHGARASKPPAPTRRGHHRAPVRRFRGSRRSHLDQRLRHRTGFTRLQHPDNAADAARTRAFRRRGPPNGYFHTSHTSSHATHRFTCVSRGGVAFIVGAWTCQESSSWCSPSRGPSI